MGGHRGPCGEGPHGVVRRGDIPPKNEASLYASESPALGSEKGPVSEMCWDMSALCSQGHLVKPRSSTFDRWKMKGSSSSKVHTPGRAGTRIRTLVSSLSSWP